MIKLLIFAFIGFFLLNGVYFLGKCSGYVKGHVDGLNDIYDPPRDAEGHPLGDDSIGRYDV